ncbi:MAG: hypothetical protein AB8B93_09875 [Pseudomonadales bacterium]
MTAQQVSAVAFCALRDPVNTIYALFPEADGYRSSVRTVGRPARETVVNELPATLHFNELGRHTLYIALKEGRPIGLVHARSEADEWGITEYAWAISPGKEIRDVIIQRSRNPVVRKMPREAIVEVARGKSRDALKSYYTSAKQQGQSVTANIAIAALKVLVITQSVWPDEFNSLMAQAPAPAALPTANAEPIPILYDQIALTRLSNIGLDSSPAFRRPLLQGYRITDPATRKPLLLVRAPFDLGERKGILWWTLDAQGEVISVIDETTSEPDERFASVVGYAPLSMKDCSNLADLAALELATLSRHHASG